MILELLVIVSGFIFILKTEKVVSITGEIPFAEKIFGGGGTYMFVKVIGVAMIVFTFMWMTGGLQSFLKAIFGTFLYVPEN